jgi:hypothetical protein
MIKKLPLFLAIITFSCQQKEENSTQKYFDIKSLFTNQINVLSTEKPVFVKNVEINSEKETKEFDSIDWKKELDPFVMMDINKPAYAKSYEIIETDSTLKYLLKKDEKLPISSIWMMKKRNSNQISFIEIASNEENMLYGWNKSLTAEFEKGILKKYNISGKQKIMIFDEEVYKIEGVRK